jgi:SLT domain-containing protein
MRIVKLAAGLAAGYLLGARAGREQYERIAAALRSVSAPPGGPSAEQNPQGLPEPDAAVAAPPADVATIERPTPAITSDKPRRPRNRRTKAATSTAASSSTDDSPAMSTANLDLDAVPMEAAEADVIEQHMPVADRSDDPTPTPLESDATDAHEQRRSV